MEAFKYISKLSKIGKKLKILIIEDEKDILNKLKDPMENIFGNVYDALNGESAKKIIDSEKPDIILLDLTVPKISGIEILQYLHDNKTLPFVIVVSAHDEYENVSAAYELGARKFIKKPVDYNLLYKTLYEGAEEILKKKQKNKIFSISIPGELYDELENYCKNNHCSKSSIITKALTSFLDDIK